MVACCALLPLLLAGGLLASVGGFLGNPWVIGTGIAVLVLAVLATTRRRSGGNNARHGCCPPVNSTHPSDTKDDQNR
tara:strand:+ start:3176 stop:3406 length:231 start_codon:yes stop_codon:yes gene_type:complete